VGVRGRVLQLGANGENADGLAWYIWAGPREIASQLKEGVLSVKVL
jgi:hypothetical protein